MTLELERKFRLAVTTYLPQYRQLVEDRFGDIQTISSIIPAFNKAFPNEPKGEKWVTHPDSLKDGNMTCDMAVMILALWWNLQKDMLSNVAYQHIPEGEHIEPHYHVGLPIRESNLETQRQSYFTQREQEQVFQLAQIDGLQIAWLHWLRDGKLQTIGRKNGRLTVPINVSIQEITATSFAINRIKNRALPHTHQIVTSTPAEIFTQEAFTGP